MLRLLSICFQRRFDRPRFEYTEQFVFDCTINAKTAERDARWLAAVEPATKARVDRGNRLADKAHFLANKIRFAKIAPAFAAWFGFLIKICSSRVDELKRHGGQRDRLY